MKTRKHARSKRWDARIRRRNASREKLAVPVVSRLIDRSACDRKQQLPADLLAGKHPEHSAALPGGEETPVRACVFEGGCAAESGRG
jgi:hypothetical protein